MPLKGLGQVQAHDGTNLRIAIVHARWNTTIINALVDGAKKTLKQAGVQDENVVVQDVPGSYELPFAVQRVFDGSKVQAAKAAPSATSAVTDLLSSTSSSDLTATSPTATHPQTPIDASLLATNKPLQRQFDAVIAIGVLIKGETMHFEYIADAASHGLMKLQLEQGIPIIFGLLTVLNEEQGNARAGLLAGTHCHGEDWGRAAVEIGVKQKQWATGSFI